MTESYEIRMLRLRMAYAVKLLRDSQKRAPDHAWAVRRDSFLRAWDKKGEGKS